MNPWKALTFATLIAVGSTLASAQQSASEPSMQTAAPPAQQDRDDADWGWIGLLGLAGLIGLKRRDREPTVRTANRSI